MLFVVAVVVVVVVVFVVVVAVVMKCWYICHRLAAARAPLKPHFVKVTNVLVYMFHVYVYVYRPCLLPRHLHLTSIAVAANLGNHR